MILWKNNKKVEEYELNNDKIISQFVRSKYFDITNHYGIETCFKYFLSMKDGLNSSYLEDKDYYDILNILRLDESLK